MRIGLIGAVPPSAVLPEDCIGARYRKHAHPAPWIGGVLPGLARHGEFELRVFVVHRAVTKRCEVERDGVVYEGVPSPVLERFAPHTLYHSKSMAVRGAVRRFKPDLIHAFGMENGSATVALRHGVPVSCFLQGIAERLLPFYGSRSLLQKKVAVHCEAEAVRKVRWMIAETEFAKDWAKSHHPTAHVEVIPHPVRTVFLGIDPEPEAGRLFALGELSNHKGMDTIIRAFARLTDSNATLWIGGGGSGKMILQRLAMRLGVAARVRFTGSLDSDGVVQQMRRASVFLIASRMDTAPNVITEAHASSVPVIGTCSGGIPEMINDGIDGFLIEVDDEVAMAEKIALLNDAPDRACEMGRQGRRKVQYLNDPERAVRAQTLFFSRIRSEIEF